MKRVFSIILAAVMLMGVLPMNVIADEVRGDPVLLPAAELPVMEYAEGIPYAGFASGQANLPERGLYALTLRRAGDTSLASAVLVTTVDVSAVYGRDYAVKDSNWSTEKLESDGTILENSADEESRRQTRETLDAIEGLVADSMYGTADGDIPADEPEPEDASEAAKDPESLTLAELKELQSGMPVRETTESEFTSLAETFLSQANIDPAEYLPITSVTRVEFAPGEREQTLTFRILEDGESEGQEMFNFLLSAADDCTAIIEAASSLSVIIEDDEPVEHSLVSFDAPSYTALDGFANVTVTRTGALYSYVTVNLRASEKGSAKEGENFEATDLTLVFQPFQEEAVAPVPVTGGEEDTRFALELYELRGAEPGEIMTAEAVIPAGCSAPAEEKGEERIDDSYLDDFDRGGAIMGSYPSSLTLDGIGEVSIEYKDTSNPSMGTIILGQNEIGKYYASRDGIYNITTGGDGDHVYHIGDDGTPHLYLEYYSGLIWRHGWTTGTVYVPEPVNRYRMILADLSTGSSYSASKVGLTIQTMDGNGSLLTYDRKEIGDENARKPRLATSMFHNNGSDFSPYPWGSKFQMSVHVQRTTNDLNRPSAKVYGFVMLYREYRVKMVQPAAMEFRTGELRADGTPITKKLVPAQVASATDTTRYTGQDIQITESPAPGNLAVFGTLTGYNIKPLDGSAFFFPSNSTRLTLNDNLMAVIDQHTPKLTKGLPVSDGNTNLGYTSLTVQPVYTYRDVNVKLLPPTGIPEGAEYHYQDRVLEKMRKAGKTNSFESRPNLLWDFSTDNAMNACMGGTSQHRVTWAAESDGGGNAYYHFTATGSDPYVSINRGVHDASAILWAKLRVKNLSREDRIQLFAAAGGNNNVTAENCADIYLNKDTEWHTYIVDLAELNRKTTGLSESTWTGEVKWIRLDPGTGRSAELLIDYVAFFANKADAEDYRPEETFANVFHVGDTLNLTMTTPVEDAYFTQYSQYQYINPGDTAYDKNSSGDLDVTPNEVPGRTLFYTKNEVRGHFTDRQNYIRVELDEDAQKYFTVRDLVPQSVLAGTVREGENVLMTNPSGSTAAEKYTPVTGRGYTVILDPSAENDGTWRPVITISGTGQQVNGFAADFIAANNAQENVISVGAEKTDPAWYEYFIVDGGVYYSAYSLRPQSEEITSSPAMQATVTAGGASSEIYVSGGELALTAQRFTAVTKDDGTFSIEGLRAVSGDTISVMADNNDMQQVIYVKLRSVYNQSFRREASFDEMRPDPSTGANENERVTASCAVNRIAGIDMPIRAYHSPYVSNVNYQYKKSVAETRYNTVPIMAGDELTLTLTAVPNGADIRKVLVVKVGRNGFKTEVAAQKTSGEEQILTEEYEVRFSADDLTDGDRFYVTLTAVPAGGKNEITYTALDTGLVCYIPKEEPPQQYFSYDMPNPYDGLPVLGSMAGNLSSGKLTWKTVYADEKNKGTSPYAEVISLAATVNDALFKANLAKLDNVRNGPKASKSWDQMIGDDNSDVFKFLNKSTQDEYCEWYKENHEGATNQDAMNYFNSTPEVKDLFRDEITKGAKKDALTKTGSAKITASVNLILQLEYDYDPVKNDHFYSGGQYIISVCGNVNKTFYWTVYGWPVFLNISGSVSVQFDGRYVTDKGVTTAREMGYYDDLTSKLKTEWPWFQFGIGIKLQPGIGICGILGARGILDFAFVARYNAGIEKGPAGGTMGTFTGGVGVDLLVFSFNYTIGSIGWKTGVFKTGGLQSDGMGEYYELRAFDPGEEYGSGPLRGIFVPSAKTTLIGGAMEYIRPQLLDLGDGRTMLLFLRNMTGEGRDVGNASALVYAIRNSDGTWEKDEKGNIRSVTVEKDEEADSTFAAMRAGDRVYIAWTNARVDPRFADSADSAKASLQSGNIRLAVWDPNSGEMVSDPIPVTNDRFVNSNVMMAAEGDKIALYYYKKDIGKASKITDLVGLTNNYGTWARKVYDPALGQFIEISSGEDPTEEYIVIRHPTLRDPLVTDLDAADFSYTSLDGETKDYRFYSYTVDRDGRQETAADRELWVQASNLTDGRDYYPVPIDANRSSILAPKLTKAADDVYLTWLSDGVVYNTVSAQGIFYALDHEDGTVDGTDTGAPYTSLERVRSLSADEIAESGWNKLPYQALGGKNGEWHTMLEKLATCDMISTSVDFSSSVNYDGEREGMMLTDHQLVVGGDGNLYLFWTGQDNEDIESDFGRELYGAAMFRADSQADGGDLDRPNWSNAVKLTDYGKVIDELTVSVGNDGGAILVGNLYTQEIDADGRVVYSDHELAEIDFVPGSSLEIGWRTIELSDAYPVEGEKVTASMTVNNNGLLPAKRYELTVNGETEIVEDADICPGDGATVERTFTAGAGGELTVSAEVTELDSTQKLAVKDHGANTASVSTKTGALPAFGTAAVYSMPEEITPRIDASLLKQNTGADFETLLNLLTEPFDPEVRAVLKATTGKGTYADYIVCVPVTNVGNRPGSDLTVTVTALEETADGVAEGDVLGTTTIPQLPVKTVDEEGNPITETVYAVIPLKSLDARKHLDEMGVLSAEVSFTLDGAEMEDTLHVRRQILRNQILEVNGDIDELDLEINGTADLSVKAYPWDGLKDLVYSSQDPGVALVSEDGTVIGTGGGSTHIMIEDMSSNPLYKAVKVNVSGDPETTDKTALDQKIGEAEILEEELAEEYPEIAGNLEAAILSARSVSGYADASQTVIDNAAANLQNAIEAAINAVRLAENKEEFEAYKQTVKDGIEPLERQDDSPLCRMLIADAVRSIEELDYDEGQSLEENKAALDRIADLLVQKLAEQRAKEAREAAERDNWLNFYSLWKAEEARRRREEQNAAKDPVPEKPAVSVNPFRDVAETDPYYGDVLYVWEKGIMNGVGNDLFAPLAGLTRGMIVTVLHRMEGEPEVPYSGRFSDVPPAEWYAAGVEWAASEGIVKGYGDGRFGPSDPVTREQLAAILYRYAQFRGYEIETADLDAADAESVSGWAEENVKWAAANGILGLTDGAIRPTEPASRAEIATAIRAFLEGAAY